MTEYILGLAVGTLITNVIWSHFTYKTFVESDDTVDRP